MKRITRYTSIFVLLIMTMTIAIGCSSQIKKSFDYGTLEENEYKNSYFDFSMQLPEDWNILLPDPPKADKDTKSKTPLNLVAAFKYPAIAKPDFNPSFICMAEKLEGALNTGSGQDYLNKVKDTLIKSQLPYKFEKDVYMENIGGKDFYVLEAAINSGNFSIYQKSYAVVIEGYALVFSVSYSQQLEMEELNQAIKTVRFNK